jgi:hypothetical protein
LAKLKAFMVALGQQVRGGGRIYLTGGATALLHGWRAMTIDIDLKPDPEPLGLFESLATLKDQLDINVKLASPDQFIPAIPGWRERSLFIARHGSIEFFHYDPYGQALSKLQRRHDRDLQDVRSMLRVKLIAQDRLREMFTLIKPQLIRYPAIEPASFEGAVLEFTQPDSQLPTLNGLMSPDELMTGLPGEALLRKGLADFQSGRCTVPACLVSMAQSRLRRAGLIAGVVPNCFAEPERQLYRLLREEGGDAYSRYNALIRELVSFEQALDRRQNKKLKAASEKAQT